MVAPRGPLGKGERKGGWEEEQGGRQRVEPPENVDGGRMEAPDQAGWNQPGLTGEWEGRGSSFLKVLDS